MYRIRGLRTDSVDRATIIIDIFNRRGPACMMTGVTADIPKKIKNTESNPKIQNLLISLIEVGLACIVTGVTADTP